MGIVKKEDVEETNLLNQKAQATIVMGMADDQLPHVIEANSAHETWTTLADMYNREDYNAQMRLREKYASFKYKGPDMKTHISELKKLIMEMKGVGANMHDEDTCMTLVRSLPKEYDAMVQAFRMSNIKWQFRDLTTKILSETERIQDMEDQHNEELAMFGHGTSRKNPPKKVFRKFNKSHITCFNCGKKGHYKRDCYSKAKTDEKDPEGLVAFSALETIKHDDEAPYKMDQLQKVALHVHDGQQKDPRWVIDSGATSHMCFDATLFESMEDLDDDREILTAKKGSRLQVQGIGNVKLRVHNGTKFIKSVLEKVLYVPELNRNLFSIPVILSKNMAVNIEEDGCTIRWKGRDVATGTKSGPLILLNTELKNSVPTKDLWHRRLGHTDKKMVEEIMSGQTHVCETCQVSKGTRMTFKTRNKKNNKVYQDGLVCSDVMGPITPSSIGENKYVVTFTIMKTRFVTIYIMKSKDEVIHKFKQWMREIKCRYGYETKILRSDNGREYKNVRMSKLCEAANILQEFSVPYNPEQNGMSERMNRTLIEMTRSMLNDSNMKKTLWAEAIMTAAFIKNRVPNSSSKKSPYELMTGSQPEYSEFRVFGSKCYAHIPSELRKKLDNTSVPCRFLGYATEQKAYRLMQEKDGKVINSRSVIFDENRWMPPMKETSNWRPDVTKSINLDKARLHAIERSIDEEEETRECEEDSEMNKRLKEQRISESSIPDKERPRKIIVTKESMTPGRNGENETNVRPPRKKREAIPDVDVPDRYTIDTLPATPRKGDRFYNQDRPPRKKLLVEFNEADNSITNSYEEALMSGTDIEGEDATTYEEVMKSNYKVEWMKAMKHEMKSIKAHDTWTLCKLPKGKKAIQCRWLFKVKRNADNSINRFKARLCAKGFTQRYGIDYVETFAPVVKMSTLRCAFAVAAERELEIKQIDIETAFLNGVMEEEIYMNQPDGFQEQGKDIVCRLKKGLYGTKQAARQWNEKINSSLQDMGLTQSDADPCLYTKILEAEYTLLIVYVDDIVIFSNNMEKMNQVIEQLKNEYGVTEFGEPRYCLGIEIHRNRESKTIQLTQHGYILKTAERFGLKDSKSMLIPADPNQVLMKSNIENTSVYPYRQLIGSLMYAMTGTRPDIANALGEVAKYCDNYTKEHWAAAKRILKYLKSTSSLGIKYCGDSRKNLQGYADANWATDVDTRRSTTGYVFTLNTGAVSWKSRRQPTVAASTTEAEYMALFDATREAIWLRRLLKDMKMLKNKVITIYQDNQGCIALAKNPVSQQRTKHIDIKFHFVREQVKMKTIELTYMKTDEMLADGLTKNLSRTKFNFYIDGLGLRETIISV